MFSEDIVGKVTATLWSYLSMKKPCSPAGNPKYLILPIGKTFYFSLFLCRLEDGTQVFVHAML